MGKISLSFLYLFVRPHSRARGQVSVGVWAMVALLSNDERCSIVAGVLGSLVVLSGRGARMHLRWATRSVCHVITWMGGR